MDMSITPPLLFPLSSHQLNLEVRRAQLFPERVERKLDDEEQHSASRREPEDLGQEARVESADAFFARDEGEGGERPVVFRGLAGDLQKAGDAGVA